MSREQQVEAVDTGQNKEEEKAPEKKDQSEQITISGSPNVA